MPSASDIERFCKSCLAGMLELHEASIESSRSFASLGEAGRIAGGTHLPPPQPIFPRYVDETGDETPAN